MWSYAPKLLLISDYDNRSSSRANNNTLWPPEECQKRGIFENLCAEGLATFAQKIMFFLRRRLKFQPNSSRFNKSDKRKPLATLYVHHP